jgi:hypothetical protein
MSRNIAEDLRALLRAAGVVGAVLVDASHQEQGIRQSVLLLREFRRDDKTITE